MSIIQSLELGLFQDESLFQAEVRSKLPLRLALLGLLTVCNKKGRFPLLPKALKSQILPYDALDFSEILAWLIQENFIEGYLHQDGKHWAFLKALNPP